MFSLNDKNEDQKLFINFSTNKKAYKKVMTIVIILFYIKPIIFLNIVLLKSLDYQPFNKWYIYCIALSSLQFNALLIY